MALTDDNNGLVMPVQPLNYGYNNSFGGLGGFGSDWIAIFLIAMMFGGGWGGFGGFGGGFGGYGNMMLGYDFPWLLNGQNGISNNVNDGFRSAQISDSITSVRDGVSNLATQLCGCCGDVQMAIAGTNQNISNGTAAIQNSLCQGFAGTTAAITGAQNAITAQMYNNEIANLNRSFDAQTANSQNFNSLQAQLATEACATRAANTQNTQAILDKLCQLELDTAKAQIEAKNDTIAQLRQEVLYARGQASQVDQTARILAGQAAEIDGVYNRLKNCPVNTVPVYGNQPIFTCPQNQYSTCGCGCGA